YHVEVTSTSGREYVSETYCVDKDRELKVYPNPVSPDGTLTIDYPFTEDEKKNLRVEVYDAMGIMVSDFVPTSYPINFGINLPEGHYFVLIYESDERMLDARFIVR
ncbi:MAG: T9SS type A sorting domain-containing protein, partial [Paludibacteraceae bacterium]|nr:T9SS type A sorting domain-containing protein [Paludibacteraceae bacterium]